MREPGERGDRGNLRAKALQQWDNQRVRMCLPCAVSEHERCYVVGCDGCAVCLALNPDERRADAVPSSVYGLVPAPEPPA